MLVPPPYLRLTFADPPPQLAAMAATMEAIRAAAAAAVVETTVEATEIRPEEDNLGGKPRHLFALMFGALLSSST